MPDSLTIGGQQRVDSIDQQVFRQVAQWLAAGRNCWVCTVVATVGAAPRPVGSLLACSADAGGAQAAVVGSLSGGCVEDDLLEKLRSGALPTERPQRLEYGVSAEENERLGLPCGGRLHILVEHWRPDPATQAQLGTLSALLAQRRIAQRTVELHSGEWTVQSAECFAPLALDSNRLLQCYGPRYQLLLIGAGEIARCLAAMAQMLDYRVLVCDPRGELIERWSLDGVQLLHEMPDDAVREHCRDDAHSIVITLTHDPRIDDMALMEALRHDLFYVGALGSQRTSENRRARLAQLDLDETQIARLHAPVGLNIGSKRPPEIAIAILAELTQLRSERR